MRSGKCDKTQEDDFNVLAKAIANRYRGKVRAKTKNPWPECVRILFWRTGNPLRVEVFIWKTVDDIADLQPGDVSVNYALISGGITTDAFGRWKGQLDEPDLLRRLDKTLEKLRGKKFNTSKFNIAIENELRRRWSKSA